MIICFFSGSRILIAGGLDTSYENTNTSYILEVNFDDTTITNIHYKDLPNIPRSVPSAAFGRFLGRSLIIGGVNSNGQCIEFDQEEYQVIPSLNVNRYDAASTFIQNKIVVAGGLKSGSGNLDTIEIHD